MEDRVGATFDARITGVTRFGLFVRLAETGAEGLIPARTLGAEYFRHDERAQALIGERTGTRLQHGRHAHGQAGGSRAPHRRPALRTCSRRSSPSPDCACEDSSHSRAPTVPSAAVAKRDVRHRRSGRDKPSAASTDAATLVLVRRDADGPRVLMGQRHGNMAFMANKYVFPGGRVDPCDGRLRVGGALKPHVAAKLHADHEQGAGAGAGRDPRDVRGSGDPARRARDRSAAHAEARGPASSRMA